MSLVSQDADRRLVGAIRLFGYLAGWLLLFTVGMAALWAPGLPDCDDYATAVSAPDNCQTSPLASKLLFFHVPVAFGAYAMFLVLAYSSWRYLARADRAWDEAAGAAAEVGVLFSALTLVSGSLWGHLEWGEQFGYWRNSDIKLVLTLVMFLVYAGYLVLRKQVSDPRRRGRVAAVYGLLGFVTVPLSYAAQRIWQAQSIHPTIFRAGDPNAGIVTEGWNETFLIGVFAFLALAAFFFATRLRLAIRDAEREVEA